MKILTLKDDMNTKTPVTKFSKYKKSSSRKQIWLLSNIMINREGYSKYMSK